MATPIILHTFGPQPADLSAFNASPNSQHVFVTPNYTMSLARDGNNLPDGRPAIQLSIVLSSGVILDAAVQLQIASSRLTISAGLNEWKPDAATLSSMSSNPDGSIDPPQGVDRISINGVQFTWDSTSIEYFSPVSIDSAFGGGAPPGSGGQGQTPPPFTEAEGQALAAAVATLQKSLATLSANQSAFNTSINAQLQGVATGSDIANVTSAVNTVNTTLGAVQTTIAGVQAPIVDAVNTAASNAATTLAAAQNAIVGSVANAAALANQATQAVATAVQTGTAAVVSQAQTTASDTVSGLNTLATDVVQGSKDILSGISSDLSSATAAITSAAGTAAQGVTQALQTGLAALTAGPAALATALTPALSSIAAGLSAVAPALQAGASDLLTKFLEGLSKPIKDALAGVINAMFGLNLDPPTDPVWQALFTNPVQLASTLSTDQLGRSLSQLPPGFRELFGVIIAMLMYVDYLKTIADVGNEGVAQSVKSQVRNTLPGVQDIMDALFRQTITTDDVHSLLSRHGLSDGDQAFLIDNARTIPTVIDLAAGVNRGFIDEATYKKLLGDLRFTPAMVDLFSSLRFILPGVSDLIFMMRRDVFIPEFVEKYQMDAEFPQAELEFFTQNGLTEEWAHRYWQAHWDLPSPQMAFEMYQRQVITADDLNRLLRAQGFEPYWRDKLTAIAYTPITRIDIRRYNKLGFLTRDQMIQRYQFIGYSPDDAKLAADFTEKLNGLGERDFAAEVSTLSVKVSTELYNDGIITRDQFRAALIDKGEPADIADAYLQLVDIQNSLKNRKAQAAIIVAKESSRLIQYTDAVNQLNALNLTPPEFEKYLAQILHNRTVRLVTVPKTDLDRFLTEGFITKDQYTQGLEALGYSQPFIDLYIRELTGS